MAHAAAEPAHGNLQQQKHRPGALHERPATPAAAKTAFRSVTGAPVHQRNNVRERCRSVRERHRSVVGAGASQEQDLGRYRDEPRATMIALDLRFAEGNGTVAGTAAPNDVPRTPDPNHY